MNFARQSVLITGASGGIGIEISKLLDELGCKLILAGRNKASLDKLAAGLKGRSHIVVAADLTKTAGRQQLVDAARDTQVSILINAMGTNALSLVTAMSDQQIEQITSTNLLAPMQICREILPLLQQQTESTIVNVGSILGSIGYAGSAVYCASKFGLRGFTESLRRELGSTGTRVIYFAPRATNTSLNTVAMQNMNKALGTAMDEPIVVANRLIKILQRGSRSKNYYLGWPEAFFVRLNGLLPALVDNALLKQLPVIRRYAVQSAVQSASQSTN